MRMRMSTIDVGMRLGDTMTHFIWQTDLKPLSGTNAKNGAIPPSLTPTMHIIHARCYKASEWVGGSLQCRRGILVILWMLLVDVAFVSNKTVIIGW